MAVLSSWSDLSAQSRFINLKLKRQSYLRVEFCWETFV